MNKDYLLTDLSKILLVDKNLLTDNICLNEELYWDSLSIVSTAASIKNHYNAKITCSELMICETIADIFSLIKNAPSV